MMFTNFDHVGLVVRDLDDALRRVEDVLGVTPAVVRELPDSGTRVAFIPLRAGRLELIQPLNESGPTARFLASRGEGMHHVNFRAPDITSARANIAAAGGRLVNDAPREGYAGAFEFVHPESTGGVLVGFGETTLFTPGVSREIGLHHVTIRTHDAGAASALWRDMFRMPIKRRAISEGYAMDTAWLDAGDAEVEFAQQLNDTGPVARALKAMGEGLHALVIESDYPEAVEERARGAGARVVVDDGEPENVLRAIHPLDFLGTLVLIARRDAAHAGMARTEAVDAGGD